MRSKMNRILKLFPTFLLFGIVLVSSGCQPEGIIPRDDMVVLLSEFYKADACIDAANASYTRAQGLDSLRVYQPIVEQYGYTKEIFRSSVEYYLHHPDDLNKIFKKVTARLKKESVKMSDAYADDGRIQEEQEDVLDEPGDAPEEVMEIIELKDEEDEIVIREGVEPEIEKPDELKLDKPAPQEERKAPKKPTRKKITKKDMKRLEEAMK